MAGPHLTQLLPLPLLPGIACATPVQPWFPGRGAQPLTSPQAPPCRQEWASGGCTPIKPVDSAEGFSSFNGFSLSMYSAVTHQSSPLAPGLPADLAGVRSSPQGRAAAPPVPGQGWKLLSPPASPRDLQGPSPVQDLCLRPLCVAGVPWRAELCSEHAGWVGGCCPLPQGGLSRCLHPCPSLQPPLMHLPPSAGGLQGPGGQQGLGAVLPLPGLMIPRGGGGVSRAGAVGGSWVPIANGMRSRRRVRSSVTSARRSGHAKRVAAHPGPGLAALWSPHGRAPSPAWGPGAARLPSMLQTGAERSCGERGRMGLVPAAMASPMPRASTAGSQRHCLWLGMQSRGPARAGPSTLGTDPLGEGVHPLSTTGL